MIIKIFYEKVSQYNCFRKYYQSEKAKNYIFNFLFMRWFGRVMRKLKRLGIWWR